MPYKVFDGTQWLPIGGSATPNALSVVVSGPTSLELPDTAQLGAVATYVEGTPAVLWTKTAGPETYAFDDATRLDPVVTFGGEGTYTFQCQVSDGVSTATDTITVDVQPGAVVVDPPLELYAYAWDGVLQVTTDADEYNVDGGTWQAVPSTSFDVAGTNGVSMDVRVRNTDGLGNYSTTRLLTGAPKKYRIGYTYGSTMKDPGDTGMIAWLEGLGFAVTSYSTASGVNAWSTLGPQMITDGVDMAVMLGETYGSGSTHAPAYDWDRPWIVGEHAFVYHAGISTVGVSDGSQSSVDTRIYVLDTNHPFYAGATYEAGDLVYVSTGNNLNRVIKANVASGGVITAEAPSDATLGMNVAFDVGAQMRSGVAPHRRVYTHVGFNPYNVIRPDGLIVFQNQLMWALNRPQITSSVG